MGDHIRCQIEYSKGFENYIVALVEDIKTILEMDEVQNFYFFWQDYSDRFERDHYWEDNFVDTWYALNQKESELLLDSRMKNAEIALKTLEAYREGDLEHQPSDLVARNYHLTANQHGMTHWDEFKFCLKRAIEIPIIQLTHRLGLDFVHSKIFLREFK